jgi:hypothetical protein
MRYGKETLRSQKNQDKVICPVKVTLEVSKRRRRFFADLVMKAIENEIKKITEPPVCHYGSNEPTLASQFEWSVNTFKETV